MYAAIDIETIEKEIPAEVLAAEEQKIIERVSRQYKQDETIKKHLVDDLAKFKEKWKFSRQGCQVVCVGVGMWSAKGDAPTVITFTGEEGVIVRDALTMITDQRPFKIFSYNGDSFDWPILLAKAMKHDIKLQNPIDTRVLYDLIKYPLERFQSKPVKFDELCEIYGIDALAPCLDGIEPPYDGSKVAEMYTLDKHDGGQRVALYCRWDVMKVCFMAQKLMGVVGL